MRTNQLLALVPFLLNACGEGEAGPGYDPPFATLNGTIQSSAIPTGPELHVALVWKYNSHSDASGSTSYLGVAQEVGVRAQFPAQFHLDVTDLPPEDAMLAVYDSATTTTSGAPPQAVPGVRQAQGTIVVYEDTNGNGKLDLIPLDNASASSPDRVLGVPEDILVIYTEGTPTDSRPQGHSVWPPGFRLLRFHLGSGGLLSADSFPIATPIDLSLTADPRLAEYICDRQFPDGCSITPGGQLPQCQGVEITCNPDGLAYTWELCVAMSSLCGPLECFSDTVERPPGTPPDGWPCP